MGKEPIPGSLWEARQAPSRGEPMPVAAGAGERSFSGFLAGSAIPGEAEPTESQNILSTGITDPAPDNLTPTIRHPVPESIAQTLSELGQP